MKIITKPLSYLRENCYIYYDEVSKKAVIIDPGFADESIERAVSENGLEVKAVLLTHGHFDHMGGADLCRAKFGAPVHAFEKEIGLAKTPELNGSSYFTRKSVTVDDVNAFSDGSEFVFGAGKLKVIHTPGHTAGSVCFYDGENGVLFSGDTLFLESVGRTDFATGSREELLKSINERLFCLPESVKVYPGHGPATDIGHEKAHNPFTDED